ncbi:PAS domain S-box protein [Haloarculaceae archaeon H-GB2-1]|nr:PAS domain S-box protein [Haloarculaceae archaeon H-GB1-1]MEA5386378.1 PAS domain S-box protein [Haloarculaceae archaeon H-GB11]MEA5407886.1 PAS domain S-box protein [Haloarculaceae archaeon H-GB2-1]
MSASTGGDVCVLHVDDDPALLDLSAEFLERERDSFSVRTTTDVFEALEVVSGESIDCVVSDYQMPEMNGLEFLEEVRTRRPRIPFVLFTGKGSEEIASEAITAGVTDYHQKGGGVEQWTVLANKIDIGVDHYRAAEALRESENRYRTVVERSHDGIFIYQDGIIRFVNDRACEITGYERAELVGTPVESLLHEADRERVLDVVRGHTGDERAESPTTYRARIRRKDDEVRHLELSAKEITYEGVESVLGSARDVTEQVEQRRALQRERDRISALFENIAVPIIYYEFDGTTPHIRDVNPAFEKTFGYPRTEVVGANIDDVIVPPTYADEAGWFNRRLQSGERIEADVTRQTAEGPREFHILSVPLTPGQRCDRGYAVYTDITDRKRHEQRLNAIQESSRELMRANTAREVAEIVSRAAKETLEYPINSVMLADADRTELVPVATTPEVAEYLDEPPTVRAGDGLIWNAFERGEPRVYDDVRTDDDVYNPDTPFRSEFYVPIGEHGIFVAASAEAGYFEQRDAALVKVLAANAEAALERAEREMELRTQRSALERQNERLDEFASVVSHDLRNPLNVILGRVAAAREAPAPEHLDRIEESARHMERLVEDLLSLAREGEVVDEVSSVDLEAVAQSAWQQVDTQNATLTVEPDVSTVQADEPRLHELLENLFRNAIDHSDPGAMGVHVTVGPLPGGGFYVADDGPGIDPEDRDQVFERGYTSEDQGTGFGLFIVADIADAHGWSISVQQSDTGGACFEVRPDDSDGA